MALDEDTILCSPKEFVLDATLPSVWINPNGEIEIWVYQNDRWYKENKRGLFEEIFGAELPKEPIAENEDIYL